MGNPLKAGPNLSATTAASLICLALGGVAGYGVCFWRGDAKDSPIAPAGISGAGPGKAGMMMGGGPGKGGGGGFGLPGQGGGQQANPTRDLTTLFRRLATIEKVAGQGLKAEQKTRILARARDLQSAKKVGDEESEKQLQAIKALLSDAQNEALEALAPARGGGFGGGGQAGGFGGTMAGAGKAPIGPMALPVAGGGGPPAPSPDNPFATGPGKERLDELVELLKK